MNPSFRGCPRSAYRFLLCGLLTLAGLALGACSNSVGSGVAPSYLVITKPGTATTVNTLQMYECLTSGLGAVMYFSNGSAGNFTGRVKWSSSDTGAVQVSNGDIPIPGTSSFYPSGTLVPQNVGNAVITADYYGIVSQTQVTVSAPKYFKLQAFVQGSRVPLDLYNDVFKTGTSNGNTFSMGTGTSVQLSAVANLAGVETDVSAFGTWTFREPTPDASINPATGVLTALYASTNIVPTIDFPSCPDQFTNPLNQYTLTISPVQSIQMSPEFTPGTAGNPPTNISLYIGNIERINTFATLANGQLQDVSAQSTLSTNNSSSLVFAGGGTGVNNLLDAVTAGPAIISDFFDAGGTQVNAGSLQALGQTATLYTIYTCWSDPTQAFNMANCGDPTPQPGASQPGTTVQTQVATVTAGLLSPPVQFHAIGTFGVDSNGNLLTQEVTRTTSWATSNGDATISNASATIGQALGVSPALVSITASNSNARGTTTATNQVQVIGGSN